MRRLNSDSQSHKVCLGDGVSIGSRRNVIVVHVDIWLLIVVIGYRTLPDGDLNKKSCKIKQILVDASSPTVDGNLLTNKSVGKYLFDQFDCFDNLRMYPVRKSGGPMY